jgi:ATP-dependent DNA helicase RecQ
LARERLGFEQLRTGQLEAIAAAGEGRDVLAVLPTGAGKTAIYELVGLLRSGPTVVVSPLIALEDDQLAHLRDAGFSAIVLNSTQSSRERAAALASSRDAEEFVFVSPEQLTNRETREALRRAKPGLFGSTRHTSSANGVRTSAPTTCGSALRPMRSSPTCG